MKIAYLTIDDGPNADTIKKLDYLNSEGIKAIWFCLGQQLEKFHEQAKVLIKEGHIIGNHSFSHPAFDKISHKDAEEQIEKTDKIINDLYSSTNVVRPLKVFRFPYLNKGNRSSKNDIQEILIRFGYSRPHFKDITNERCKSDLTDVYITCTYDSYDWVLNEVKAVCGYHDLPSLLKRIDENVPNGGRSLNVEGLNEIVMMHSWIPLDSFTALIDKILSKNITFKLP